MRLIGLAAAVAQTAASSEFAAPASWGTWGNWSPCTDLCSDDGTRNRQRSCVNGVIGEGSCLELPESSSREEESCAGNCPNTPCAKNAFNLRNRHVVTLPAEAAEVCFRYTSSGTATSGRIFAQDSITIDVDGDDFVINTNAKYKKEKQNSICITYDGFFPKVFINGFGNYLQEKGSGGADITLGNSSGESLGIVYELSASSSTSEEVVSQAQAANYFCNSGDLELSFGGVDTGALSDDNEWQAWASCSDNCGGGRSYRYRKALSFEEGEIVQVYRSCNTAMCAPGWGDWSEWTQCDSSCGDGKSHRTRECSDKTGNPNICIGEKNESRDCSNAECPVCAYSHWSFPEEQKISNYLVMTDILPDMQSTSICFAVNSGSENLIGTVFSYSKTYTPRGNELLFIGKDMNVDTIRLYRNDFSLEIDNGFLNPEGKTQFCVVLQAQPDQTTSISIYVDGFYRNGDIDATWTGGRSVPGEGEMIIGQDQDCIFGCFNSTQAFVGSLYDFQIFDYAMSPDDVMNLHFAGICGEKTPLTDITKSKVMVNGDVVHHGEWSEWGEFGECECDSGRRRRTRWCKGGKANDADCVGSHEESEACDITKMDVDECSEAGEWSTCSVFCGGVGSRTRTINGVVETEECGNHACREISEWSDWSQCSVSCGEGFEYRSRRCFNGPCDNLDLQESRFCDNGGATGRCGNHWDLPWDCGTVHDSVRGKTGMRVVGGYRAQPKEIPWGCMLEARGEPSCGTSIVAPKWTICAAHCIQPYDKPEQFRIICGVTDRTNYGLYSQVQRVKSFYKHPKYDPLTVNFDLSLFLVENPWQFNDYVRPICLPGKHMFPQPGTVCKISGFGSTKESVPGTFVFNIQMSDVMNVAVIPILEQSGCATRMATQISRNMFCAGYFEGGKDACQGDSGGPIACRVSNDERWQLTGVVSWGIGCAQQDLPGVYTKLAMTIDWVYDHIGQNAGSDPACRAEPKRIEAVRGFVKSPLYDGSSPYGYNQHCHWIVSLTPKKGLMVVKFTEFNLEYSKHCRADSLTIYDGKDLDNNRGTWCGISGPPQFIVDSPNPEVKLVLKTNADNNGQNPTGFVMMYSKPKGKTAKVARRGGCSFPMEDTVATGIVRSVQNIGWPLNPPRNVDPTCVYTIRYFKDKANKDLVMPAVWFEEPVDPWCRKGIKLYRQKVSPKTEIRESNDILDGKPHISSKNLFIMVIDPRHAGDRCRFKMHYTGCSKKDKKGECLKVFSDRFVEAKRQTQKVETRTSGSARSCALRDYSANPNQLGLSVASDPVESYSSLVALDLVLPPAEKNPTRNRGRRSPKSKGKSKKPKPIFKPGRNNKQSKPKKIVRNVCSGSMVANNQCFVTSDACGKIVNRMALGRQTVTNARVAGISYQTSSCRMSPKMANGASVAVCKIDSPVDSGAVVPCFSSEEPSPKELLVTSSQSNINTAKGKGESLFRTWLPANPSSRDSAFTTSGISFTAGFNGGKGIQLAESGFPIYREIDDARELLGIQISAGKNDHSVEFASVTRHADWIQSACDELVDEATAAEYDRLEFDDPCREEMVIELDDMCTPVPISSPDYPNAHRNGLNCKWTIIAPENSRVVLELFDVDIEGSKHLKKCTNDVLAWNPTPERSPVHLCSSQPIKTSYTATGNRAELQFNTDQWLSGRGFNGQVTC